MMRDELNSEAEEESCETSERRAGKDRRESERRDREQLGSSGILTTRETERRRLERRIEDDEKKSEG